MDTSQVINVLYLTTRSIIVVFESEYLSLVNTVGPYELHITVLLVQPSVFDEQNTNDLYH